MEGTLIERLNAIESPTLMVVGDLMLDLYEWGAVSRISPEAPVQVLNVESEEPRPGGAGNVAANLAALGARVICCGVIGSDANGRSLKRMLSRRKIDTSGIVEDTQRPTTVKTRMLAHGQQLLRVDREQTRPIGNKLQSQLLRCFTRLLRSCDAVLLSDYGKGTLSDELVAAIVTAGNKSGLPLIVDPARDRNFRMYEGCTVLKPNRVEAEAASGISIKDETSLTVAARKLLRKARARHVVITQGGEGMTVFGKRTEPVHVAGLRRPVYDVTGAGDTVLSLLGYILGGGGSIEEAARIANVAASIVVGKVGAAQVTKAEIVRELLDSQHMASHKVRNLDELMPLREEARRRKQTLVFTNGCFDLLHVGHIKLFQFAKNTGEILIVGLNSDSSVRKLKGAGRPVLNQTERAYILSALEYVDYIVIFDETTPLKLIKAIRPDILVKGADYTRDTVVGRDFVESYGGRVELAPLVKGVSSSDIMSRIAQKKKR
jgi:D-beta-D-heptose 7-phosphate kinase/D-beta-D-heptose 1-phosphate adenosyltransferase